MSPDGNNLLHPDTSSAAFPKRNKRFVQPLRFRGIGPPVRVEPGGVGEVVLVLVEDPGAHLNDGLG